MLPRRRAGPGSEARSDGLVFAEAVFFFMVADVPITLITARSGLRTGLMLSLWAIAGALLGGVIVYLWAGADAAAADRMLDWVPAVSLGHIAAAKQDVAENWIAATLIGGFSGDPYKLYAAAAGEQGVSLLPFLAVSLVARLTRFLASAELAQALTADALVSVSAASSIVIAGLDPAISRRLEPDARSSPGMTNRTRAA